MPGRTYGSRQTWRRASKWVKQLLGDPRVRHSPEDNGPLRRGSKAGPGSRPMPYSAGDCVRIGRTRWSAPDRRRRRDREGRSRDAERRGPAEGRCCPTGRRRGCRSGVGRLWRDNRFRVLGERASHARPLHSSPTRAPSLTCGGGRERALCRGGPRHAGVASARPGARPLGGPTRRRAAVRGNAREGHPPRRARARVARRFG